MRLRNTASNDRFTITDLACLFLTSILFVWMLATIFFPFAFSWLVGIAFSIAFTGTSLVLQPRKQTAR